MAMRIGVVDVVPRSTEVNAVFKESHLRLQIQNTDIMDENESKRAKVSDGYKDINMEIYEFSEIKWPPARQEHVYCINFDGLTDQEAETVIFAVEAFPPSDDDFGKIGVLDVGESLKKLVGWPLGAKNNMMKNPWAVDYIPKLVSSTRIVIRIAPNADECPKVRLISGLEAMSFIGWDASMYEEPNPNPYLRN